MLSKTTQIIVGLSREYLDNKLNLEEFNEKFDKAYFDSSEKLSDLEYEVFEDINSDFAYCEPDPALRDHPSYIDENELKNRLIKNLKKLVH